jgi:3-oxoacyl-[acyl-carrier-protein] synthase II
MTGHDHIRVVVTGVGAVTALGPDADALWTGARAGRVGIGPVAGLPMDGLRTTVGGEIADPVTPGYSYLAGTREPAVDFALVAAAEALAASGMYGAVPPERCGVVYGSCNGGLISAERVLSGAAPEAAPLVPPQAAADALSAAYDLRGPVISVNTACASGAHAIAHAVGLIRAGQADLLLVGGSDALAATTFAGFNSLESLSPKPAAPYAKDRDGLSLGEGAGMLVLARAEVAAMVGAPVLAEVLGVGLSADGYHATAPHPQGEGAARAITAALAAAGVAPGEVGYVNGHGTGTPKNDPAEVAAVRTALGPAADEVALSSTKSMIGHLLGAAGAVESIVTVFALREQTAPPTANFTVADPHCPVDVVPNVARPIRTDVVASNNFAFAGANACVLLARPDRPRRPAPPVEEEIVVTGVSALSPAGVDPAALAEAYRSGRAPAARAVDGGVRLAPVTADPGAGISAKARRRVDRLGQLAVAASHAALVEAGLAEPGPAPLAARSPRVGVVLGTGLGPIESMERFIRPLLDGGPGLANPAVFPNTVYNAAAGQVAMLLGTTGATSTLTTLHAAGAVALTVAVDLLKSGAADAVVVPAVDVPTEAAARAYRRLPVFARADGYTLAEAGYALVLERRADAAARGARVRAGIGGYGIASDARGVGQWDPRGDGVERAIRAALWGAALGAEELTAVWTGAVGVSGVDRAERAALRRVFGARPPEFQAPKAVLGDPVGAGAHLAAALAVEGWSTGGTAGPALINSSSLGGTHVALVLTPPEELR